MCGNALNLAFFGQQRPKVAFDGPGEFDQWFDPAVTMTVATFDATYSLEVDPFSTDFFQSVYQDQSGADVGLVHSEKCVGLWIMSKPGSDLIEVILPVLFGHPLVKANQQVREGKEATTQARIIVPFVAALDLLNCQTGGWRTIAWEFSIEMDDGISQSLPGSVLLRKLQAIDRFGNRLFHCN